MNIRPDLLAGKIASVEFEKHASDLPAPVAARLKELLWFIQAVSMEKRGLAGLVEDLLAQYSPRFITPAIQAAGIPKHGKYDLAACLEIWKSEQRESSLYHKNYERLADAALHDRTVGESKPPQLEEFEDWLTCAIDGRTTAAGIARGKDYDTASIMDGLKKFNYEFFRARCLERARTELAGLLQDWCVHKSTRVDSPSYCHDLPGLLLEYMDARATRVRATIAQTEITRIVFRELEFSISQNVPVPIIGESRIGKTSPASAWCAMRPGRARLVTVPESNRMRDFIEAHALAFGIEFSPSTTTASLTALVKYVQDHSGLFICYDEAQFLTPVSYQKTTPPARLNFVRCQVIDRGHGCAFFATPQSYRQTLDQYVKTTGYRIEQWLGRMAPAIVLPADLGVEDMLAIARLNFPTVPEPYLKKIAAHAMLTEGYIKNLEFTAKRALFFAEQRGHAGKLTREDIDDAIAWLTGETSTAAPAQIEAPAVRRQIAPVASRAAEPQTLSTNHPRRAGAPLAALEPVPG